jgi:hypothetical protein
VSPTDPRAYVVVSLVLLSVAALASYLPARRRRAYQSDRSPAHGVMRLSARERDGFTLRSFLSANVSSPLTGGRWKRPC